MSACFPFTNVLFKSVCKSDGRRDGVECGITDAGVVNRAQPIRALIAAQWVPYWRKFLSGRPSGHSTQIGALCSVSVSHLLFWWNVVCDQSWLSSSECVPMFLRVFFVVSSHCSRASVACGYVFLLRPLVEVNRELQKHLLRQHKHSHTLEIVIESICLIWYVCVWVVLRGFCF